ncbi:peptidoglycan bridge formation glycyltransferase FemA/FemB family protein [Candidatus Gottesmanbacteria bacterium]|nr:peptidoglycan bridge formation glycyltransferase FemA/FemB family protein [Candidatus Gottesmanbacteria bacterium]
MIDIRQSKNYGKYMESLGWIVEGGAFIKKLWFTSIVKIQRPSVINLETIKKYHPFLIKLEPNTNSKFKIQNSKFHKDNWPLIPSKTIILDLKNINLPKDTRYEIRKAEKNGVLLKSKSLETFIKSWHQHARQKGFWVPLHKEIRNLAAAFGKDCFLFMTEGAGALVLKNGQTANYMYAFSTPEGRKVSAPYLVMWEIIKFCQSKKLKYLDLEGIYDERYPDSTKNWQGFTKFKMGWGGKIVTYPGSWTKYFLFSNIFPVFKGVRLEKSYEFL